jgi:hypothetical protein
MAEQPPGWGPPPQPPPSQPGPPAWGSPPPAQPPKPPRPWYRRPWVIILGVLGVLLVIGMLTSDPQPTTQPATTAAPTPEAKATTPAATKPPATESAETAPGLGERARDGKFEFVVSRVRCGVDRIGSQYLNKAAQGQFCLISVRVRNVGDEQRTFEQSSQYLFDTAGRRYETGDAGLYLEDSKSFLEDINPGNGVNGTLVYDVPKSFKAAKIELHDSAFSGGVEVALS